MVFKRDVMLMKDTLFDDLVFDAGQLLHHDVDETGNEARQKADQTADDPATDLQTAETLNESRREGTQTHCTDKNISGNMGY